MPKRTTKKRRANGLGGIRWNAARKRYEGTITVASEIVAHDDNGRPKYRQTRRTVTGATQGEVTDKLDKLRQLIEEGPAVPPEATVARYLEHWISDVLPLSNLAQTTRDQYERIARLYVMPTIGRKRLDQLQPADVRRMLGKLRDQGLSPATIRQARSVLSRALRTAEADGLIARNPARLVDGVKQDAREGRTLTPEQARTLLSASQGHEYEALVPVLLSLGLRKGEALGMSWRDVELDSPTPRLGVRRALKKDGRGGLYLDEPKTARSRRTVRLPAPLVDTLRAHRARQAEQRLAFGAGWGGHWSTHDLVFTNSVGAPLDPDRVNRKIQDLTEEAGLGRWTPHELRHSAASLLLAQGVPLKTVSELLGHSSIRVTADVYGHLLDDARAEAATAMESALWG
jgi:integrase